MEEENFISNLCWKIEFQSFCYLQANARFVDIEIWLALLLELLFI